MDPAFWLRLFGESGLYSDAWTAPFYPDDPETTDSSANYIWDFRMALPRYLQILEWQVFVFLAAVADDPKYQTLGGGMKDFGDFLVNDVYKKILDQGFGDIRPPDPDELKYVIFAMDPANFYWHRKEGSSETFHTYDFIDPKEGRPVRIERFTDAGIDWLRENCIPGGNWIRANYDFGQVERYSGYDCTATYPVDELKAGAPLIAFGVAMVDAEYNAFGSYWWELVKSTVTVKQPAQFERFYERLCIRHTLRKLRKRKQLYSELGLPKLYHTIRHYFSILKLEMRDELIDLHSKYRSWPVREG